MYPCRFSLPHTGYKFLDWAPAQNAFHCGWDLNLGHGDEDLGNSVYTPIKSKIEYVSPPPTRANRYNGGYGLFVILYHPGFNVWTKYAHLSKVEDIPWDYELYEGIKFAEVGKSGTKSAHLHWEMFGAEMHDIQKNYRVNNVNLPFRFYPSGKSKAYVVKYYINPMKFMGELIPSDWAKLDWSWAMKNGIVTEQSKPHVNLTKEELVVLLKNYHDKRNNII